MRQNDSTNHKSKKSKKKKVYKQVRIRPIQLYNYNSHKQNVHHIKPLYSTTFSNLLCQLCPNLELSRDYVSSVN